MSDIPALLPEGLSLAAALVLLAVSLAGGFVTAAFGIGGGLVVLAVMASLLPPAALIPIHGLVQLGSNASRSFFLRRDIHWRWVPAFLLGSLLGIALGGQLVVTFDPALVQLAVGSFILWSLVAKPPRWMQRWPVLNGAVSSFLTMFFGGTGPFVAAYVKTLKFDRHAHVATHATLMVIQHGLKVAVFGLLGFAFAPWIWLLIGLILCGALGTWLGKHVLTRLSTAHFYRILNLLLALIALRLILVAGWDLLG